MMPNNTLRKLLLPLFKIPMPVNVETILLDGKKIAADLRAETAVKVEAFKKEFGRLPRYNEQSGAQILQLN